MCHRGLGTSAKPSVLVEVKFFVGNPEKGAAQYYPLGTTNAQNTVKRILDEAGIFARYSFDPADKNLFDKKIALHFFNDFSRQSFVAIFV